MRVAEEEYGDFMPWVKERLHSFAKPDWGDNTALGIAEIVALLLSEDRKDLLEHYKALEKELSDILGQDTNFFIIQVLRGVSLRAWLHPYTLARVTQPLLEHDNPLESLRPLIEDAARLSALGPGRDTTRPRGSPISSSVTQKQGGPEEKNLQDRFRKNHSDGQLSVSLLSDEAKIALSTKSRTTAGPSSRARSRSPERTTAPEYKRIREYDNTELDKKTNRIPSFHTDHRSQSLKHWGPSTGGQGVFVESTTRPAYEMYDPTKPVPEARYTPKGTLDSTVVSRREEQQHSFGPPHRQQLPNHGATIQSSVPSSTSGVQGSGFSLGPSVVPNNGAYRELELSERDPGHLSVQSPLLLDNAGKQRAGIPKMHAGMHLSSSNGISGDHPAPWSAFNPPGTGIPPPEWTSFLAMANLMSAMMSLQTLKTQMEQLASAVARSQVGNVSTFTPPAAHPRDRFAAFNYRSPEVQARTTRIEAAEKRMLKLEKREQELAEQIRKETKKLSALQYGEGREALVERHKELLNEIAHLEQKQKERQRVTPGLQLDNRRRNVIIRPRDPEIFGHIKEYCLRLDYHPDEIVGHRQENYLLASFDSHSEAMQFVKLASEGLRGEAIVTWHMADAPIKAEAEDVEEDKINVHGELVNDSLNMDAEEYLDVAEDRDRM